MLKRLLLALGLLLAPADAFAQSSKLSNLTAGGAIAGTDLFYDVQSVGVGGVKVTGTQLSTFVLTPPVNVPLGTVTTNTLGVNITGTWNNAAQVFDAPLFENIVNTASATGSLLADFQVGGASLFSIDKNGTLKLSSVSSGGLYLQINDAGGGKPGFITNGAQFLQGENSGAVRRAQVNGLLIDIVNSDVALTRNAAGVAMLYNGAAVGSASGLQVYNTSDVSSGAPTNFERGVFDWTTNANVLTIGTQNGGTGTARNFQLVIGGVDKFDYGVSNGASFTMIGSLFLTNSNLLFSGAGVGPIWTDVQIARTSAGILEINNTTLGQFRDLTVRHLKGGGAPTASACTGFALTTGSSDLAGGITLTSGTTCSITFAAAFANAPSCVITPGSAAATTQVTTTTTTMSATFGAAQTAFSYHCIGL